MRGPPGFDTEMRPVKGLITAMVVTALLSVITNAQEKVPPQVPTGLALEIYYYSTSAPAYLPIPREKANGGWFARFGKISSWRLPEGQLPIRAVEIVSQLEGDVVSITVSVLRGVKFHDGQATVGKYALREGQDLLVKDLEAFGVEPFRLRVVRVTPVVSPQPIVKSSSKSLEVVGIELLNSTLPSYKLTLHNVSNKNITAFEIEIVETGRVVMSGREEGAKGLPLIKAGAFYESREPFKTRAERTAEGYAPALPAPQQTRISAVFFEDGSYEGDAKLAAEFRALNLGRKLGLRRLLRVFETSDSPFAVSSDVVAQAQKFRDRIHALPETPDQSVLAQLADEFPNANPDNNEEARISVEFGIHSVKVELLKELDAFLKSAPLEPSSFGQWLRKTKSAYQGWLTRL